MQKKSSGPNLWPIIIVLVGTVVLCICCFISFAFFGALVEDLDISEDTVQSGNTNEQIAIIPVEGVITSFSATDFWGNSEVDMVTSIINKLERAKNDDNVKAVILEVNSPGGEVYGSELITNKIKEVQDEGKVVVSLMKDTAASGGYFISAPTDKIVASQTTITGSIGVFIQIQDIDGLYAKLGIENYYVTNSEGDLKVVRGDLNDENSEAYQVLQSVLDDTYDLFVQVIVDGRDLSREEVVELADGRIYSGKQALELGLVDEIGYMDKAIEVATAEADLDNPKVVRYGNNLSYIGGLNAKFTDLTEPFAKIAEDERGMKLMFIARPN